VTVPRNRLLVTASLTAALAAGTASADTLREALVSTYRSNPTMMAQREALKATDATVAIARAQSRPQVSATVGVNQDLTRTGGGNGRNVSAGLDVSYPLFTGGAVKNNIRAAQTRVRASRAILQAVEGDIFTEAVAAYMDVIRDRAIVELNENNVVVLTTNLQATRDRFEVGDVTRTDIAQSEARLEIARAGLANAQSRLAASIENYKRVIGEPPEELAPPPPLPPLPATAEEAVRIALVGNPDLVAAVRQAEAAGLDVRVAGASRLPTVSAIGSGRYTNYLGTADEQFAVGAPNQTTSTGVGVQANIPLYQGGEPAARIRQAQALEAQLLEQVIASERLVVANTRSAFASYQSSLSAIESSQQAVEANELALEGARAEQTVGTRTVIEVLNAEQELLNSQVSLVSARRDAYVAGFQLLNAMGQTQAEDLGLEGGPLYDPLGNYRRVAGEWNDWASDPRHVPISTRTVTPAEEPAVPITQGVTQPRR
jgi:outer membrane protein